MLISEMFYTLQGEGKYTGHPCVFIRTSGCNLRCDFCDTPYASWNPTGDKMKIGLMLDETERRGWGKVHHYVISGGEPMIQKTMPQLVDALKERGHHITIETAGSVYNEKVNADLWSISPKLINSDPDPKIHPKEYKLHKKNNTFEYLPLFMNDGRDYQYKFVTCDDNDTKEILDIIEKYDIPKNRVYLMPEGITKEGLSKRAVEVAEICKRENLLLTGRMQVQLWGNTMGT